MRKTAIVILLGLFCVVAVVATREVRAAPIDDAMYALVSGDSTKAIQMLRALADKGDIQAEIFLGDIYHDGAEGIPKDYGEAIKWYRAVADRGVAIGQFDLGKSYFVGEGVARNGAEALRLYRLAADQGYAKAQVQVGQSYLHPGSFELKGVAANPSEGVKWLRRAAEQGDGDGQGLLGMMYEDGTGVPRDYARAYMWDTLAISSMTATKGKYFADEVRSGRDELVGKMTAAQVAEGQRLAASWKPGATSAPVVVVDPGHAMTACFINNAQKYGAQSCQPPSAMVGAVFGSCSKEEAAYKTGLSAQHPNDPKLVDDVIAQIHAKMSNSVQAALLDSQIKGGRCR